MSQPITRASIIEPADNIGEALAGAKLLLSELEGLQRSAMAQETRHQLVEREAE